MKVPDLSAVDECGVHDWKGSGEPLKAAAAHAGLRYAPVDLGKAKDKATLFAEIDRALAHAPAYRKDHPTDARMLEEILDEAAEFWQERHVPFWVFVGV